MKMKRRYEIGLEQLNHASSQITTMQAELTELQPQLIQATKEASVVLKINFLPLQS